MASIEERIHAGGRAREVLENEAFQAAFAEIEQELVKQWTESPARDADGRERLWTYLQMLRKVRATLESTMQTGKLAKQELERRRTMKERMRDGWASFSE